MLSGNDLESRPVIRVDATDLMSQVLAYSKPGTVLLTGLTNVQVVNTAEVAELSGIVFVRGLRPAETVIARANFLAIPALLTTLTLYDACGILYKMGLPGLSSR